MTRLRAVLVVSFVLNVAALLVPFVDVSKTFGGTDTYDLISSVRLLWESEIYVLAVVVVAFSIVFPFAKLASLAYLTRPGARDEPSARDLRLLRAVGALGKWSLIDVFIVCFILALASDQFFVEATPRPGLVVFLAAILGSMFAGELLARRLGHHPERAPPRVPRGVRAAVLLLSSLAFVGLLAVPFLQIDDWLLEDTEFTLVTFLGALFAQGAITVGVALSAGLVVVPAWALAASWALLRERRGRPPAWIRARDRVRHFSLLHVFLVALAIFLAEGDAWMGVVPRRGIALLALLLAIDIAQFLVTRPVRTVEEEVEEFG